MSSPVSVYMLMHNSRFSCHLSSVFRDSKSPFSCPLVARIETAPLFRTRIFDKVFSLNAYHSCIAHLETDGAFIRLAIGLPTRSHVRNHHVSVLVRVRYELL